MTRRIPRKGQAALSLVFLIGGIIILIGVTVAFLTVSFINSGFGLQASDRARATASAGVYDAMMQLVRQGTFSAATPYTVPVGSYSASVTVTQGAPIAGEVTILSKASVSFHERDIQAVAAVNATTGLINILSWKDLTL